MAHTVVKRGYLRLLNKWRSRRRYKQNYFYLCVCAWEKDTNNMNKQKIGNMYGEKKFCFQVFFSILDWKKDFVLVVIAASFQTLLRKYKVFLAFLFALNRGDSTYTPSLPNSKCVPSFHGCNYSDILLWL